MHMRMQQHKCVPGGAAARGFQQSLNVHRGGWVQVQDLVGRANACLLGILVKAVG
jgi:hypothetical protein